MRTLLRLLPLCFAIPLHAEPVLSTGEWQPACDGSTLEVVSDHSRVLSVHATAIHSDVISEWTVHYIDDAPVSAEYRETARGRVATGDHAGDYSGESHLTKIQTWQCEKDHFPVADEAQLKELDALLKQARGQASKQAAPHS